MGPDDPLFVISDLRIQSIGLCFWALFFVLLIAVDFWRRNPEQLSPFSLFTRIWNTVFH